MAQVKLGRFEAEEGELPPLCLRCGAPAVLYKRLRFSCHPDWSYVLLLLTFWPFLLALPILRQRLRVLAPLCPAHRHYWLRRRLISLGGIGAIVAFAIVSLPVAADSNPSGGSFGTVWFLFWIIGLLWLAGSFLVRVKALYAAEITEDSITLMGVSGAFVEKLGAERESSPAQRGREGDRQVKQRQVPGGPERSPGSESIRRRRGR